MDERKSESGTTMATIHARSPARFIGHYTNKIDAKGRVSIPADLRRFILPDSETLSAELYCFPSLISDELYCGGPDLVQIVLSTIESIDIFGGDHFAREAFVTGETRRLYFDDNGRVVVSKDLRDHAHLSGTVTFQGRGQMFVMMPSAQLDDMRAAARALTKEQKDTIRARSLPSTLAKKEGRE